MTQVSRKLFVGWLVKQDPTTPYNYDDNRDCAFSKFLKAQGYTNVSAGSNQVHGDNPVTGVHEYFSLFYTTTMEEDRAFIRSKTLGELASKIATVRERWVGALRSGRYEQGNGCLRYNGDNGDKFCCLGVLCDLVKPQAWVLPSHDIREWQHHGESGFPTSDVLDLVGISHIKSRWLAEMNDQGKAFTDIANEIEAFPFQPTEHVE